MAVHWNVGWQLSWSPKFSFGSRDGWPTPCTSLKPGSSGTGQGQAYSPLSGVFGRPPHQEKGLDPKYYNSHHKALQPPAVNCQTNTCLTVSWHFRSKVSKLNIYSNTTAPVLVRRKVNMLSCNSYCLWLFNAKFKKKMAIFFLPMLCLSSHGDTVYNWRKWN